MFRLKLLGSLELSDADVAVSGTPVRRLKPVVLLAYLAAARPRGFHRRDKIAAIFWPELSSDRARAALRTSLSRLREDFADDLLISRGSDEIAVNPERLWCDVVAVDDAIGDARLDEAVTLYAGQLLDGVHVDGTGAELEDWIHAERSRLLREVVRAASDLSIAAERSGDIAAAVRAAERAHAFCPSDESTARRAISLLIAAGDRGRAMLVYDELVRRLRRDLDVDVSAETAALVGPLRQRAKVADGARAQVQEATSASPDPAAQAALVSPREVPTRGFRISKSLAAAGVIAAAAAIASWASSPGTARENVGKSSVVEWSSVKYDSLGPAARFGAQVVLDSTGNALILLGGQLDPRTRTFAPLGGEVWRLQGLRAGQGAKWTRVATAPGPHPSDRWLFGASNDPAHDRIVVHGGGLGTTAPCTSDTWILNHASGLGHAPIWQQVSLRGPVPPARGGFDQVFDAKHRRLIVFAGHDCVYPHFDDTWVLAFDDETFSSGEWHALSADSSAGIPKERDLYAAAYDTASGRMFVFGGRASMLASSELWALDHANGLGGQAAWRRVECAGNPPARISAAGTFDEQLDLWTFIGGTDANANVTREVWQLRGLTRDLRHCRWEQATAAGRVPAERSAASALLLPESRGILVYGGSFESTPLGDAWLLKVAPLR